MTNPIVPQYPEAGPAQSVVVVNDAEVVGGPAIPVYGWTGLPTDGRSVEGAPAIRVKVITASDLTMNGGKFWLEGRPFAMPVSGNTTVPAISEGGVAIAVYPVNNWPSVTPPPGGAPHFSSGVIG